MCTGEIVLLVIVIALILKLLYMPIVWTNGFDSKKRVFCIKQSDEKCSTYPYTVYWRFTWLPFRRWHEYIIDAHYMFSAEFRTKEEAQEFINHQYDYMFNKREDKIEEVPYV